jgi:acyl-CoA thioesterase-2
VTDFNDVIGQIAPRQTSALTFVGDSLQPQSRIFGGQVVAQCLMAANQTVAPNLDAHSLHAYFLRAGDPTTPIDFDVDPIRDGRSFSTRRVVARQGGEAIFNTSISYHVEEVGVSHSFAMPDIPAPADEADDLSQFVGLSTKPGDPNLVDLDRIDRQRVTQYLAEEQAPVGRSWFRTLGSLPDDKTVHQAALVMISDYSLLSTVFYPHPSNNPFKDFMAASLDHAVWFHHRGEMDKWVLYDCDTPRSGGGRGLSRGFL